MEEIYGSLLSRDSELHRCMAVSPGNLVEQCQEELDSTFVLPFEILTRRSGCKLQQVFPAFLAGSCVRLGEPGHPARVLRNILRWNSQDVREVLFRCSNATYYRRC
jgi:hypothetical protein